MAFGFFMNMEKLALSISNEHIARMTNDNYWDDVFLDENKLLNNIENGFVIITQLSCYIESFLNTILNSCIGYDGEPLLKCSIEEKIEIIYMHYNKSFSDVKSQNAWNVFKRTTSVRNSMIHFKKTYIGMGSGVPNFKLGKENVAEFFTQENMRSVINEHIKLAHLIADSLGLHICEQIDVFECDGRDGLVNYVYSKETTLIDESRFE